MKNGVIRTRIFCLICVLMLMNLIGCGIKKKDIHKNIVQSDKHYTRQILDVPNGEEVTAICKSDSEILYVVTGDGKNSSSLWCVDGSNNWKKEYDIKEILGIEKNVYYEAYPSEEGGLLVQINSAVSETEGPFNSGKLYYIYIDELKNVKEIELKLPEINEQLRNAKEEVDKLNHVVNAKCIDGYMYVVDTNYSIFQIDISNGSSKCVFDSAQYEGSDLETELYIDEFYVYDEHIIMAFEDMIGIEGIVNHKREEEMTERFSEFFSQAKTPLTSFKLSIADNVLWTLCEDKICTYNLDSNESTQYKVIGTNSDEYVSSQVACNENIYATVYSIVDKKTYLYKYTNKEEVVATVSDTMSRKLKIWVLDSGEDSESASIRSFTDKYPNVEVEVEMGIAGNVTPADAIKNLNAQILAGNGPDVIYMDGLDISKYIESGELEDLSGIVKELEDSGDYFNNILEAFSKDNKVYVLPQSVNVIGKVGKKDVIEASEDGSKLLEYIENNKGNHPFIPYYSLNNYLVDQYYKYIKEDILNGTVEKEELCDYFEVSKELIKSQGIVDYPPHTLYLFSSGNYAMAYDEAYEFLICNITSVYTGPMAMDDIAKKNDGMVDYPSKEYMGYYVPCRCMAISSKSENKDIAIEYIKNTLGEDYLSKNTGGCAFTVNKKALVNKNQLEVKLFRNDEVGDLSEEEQKMYDEYLENTISYLETVDKPLTRDVLLDQMFFDEFYRYLNDEAELEAVVDGLLDKYKLYMEE